MQWDERSRGACGGRCPSLAVAAVCRLTLSNGSGSRLNKPADSRPRLVFHTVFLCMFRYNASIENVHMIMCWAFLLYYGGFPPSSGSYCVSSIKNVPPTASIFLEYIFFLSGAYVMANLILFLLTPSSVSLLCSLKAKPFESFTYWYCRLEVIIVFCCRTPVVGNHCSAVLTSYEVNVATKIGVISLKKWW